jgi:uncharacterized membrane protein YraQ (UPF0718 family)
VNYGFLALVVLLAVLALIAMRQRRDFGPMAKRFFEQFAKLVPRMLCALVAAGFVAQLIPRQTIAGLLGEEAGLLALPVAAVTGLIVPAGPVIAFAIAAVFAKAGASTPALITFVTSWSVFAAHRILIYEVPLVGASFLRLRVLSVLTLPLLAGLFAMAMGLVTQYGAVNAGP